MSNNNDNRVEYIDAMRGFTMLLVVFGHIILYGYHESEATIVSFNNASLTFYLPLFFFLSGFILYSSERILEMGACKFLKRKAAVLILPAVFFLLIYDLTFNYNIINSFCAVTKYGYWFTIALFEYFVIYACILLLIRKAGRNKLIYRALIWGGVIIATLFSAEASTILASVIPKSFLNFLGIDMLRYFPFFFTGILARKYFTAFVSITENGVKMAIIILVFFCLVLFEEQIDLYLMPSGGIPFVVVYELRFVVVGVLGLTIVFTFFRKQERLFSQNNRIGRWLQYVGRRTLDVYLLHYFFLPRNLQAVGSFFKFNSNPSIEFLVSMSIAIWVVVLCLVLSNILRVSDTLGHYLFGAKLGQKAD